MARCELGSVGVLRRFIYFFLNYLLCLRDSRTSASKIYPEANEGVLIFRIKTREYPSLSALCGRGSGDSIALSSHSLIGQQRRLESNLIITTLRKTWCLWPRKLSHSPFPWIIHICEVENRKQ